MKGRIIFALLVMIGCVMTQAVENKYQCLTNILASADTQIAGYREHIAELDDVMHLLLYYKGLSSELRAKIDTCNINQAPSIARCEKVHGKGACKAVTPTFVNKACQENFRIEGCCQCVINCPKDWKDDGYWCHKPAAINLKKFASTAECTSAGVNCVSINGEYFTEECPERFERIGGTLCLPRCPHGWNDQGWRCMKPGNYHVGHPFTWIRGDN